MPRNPQNWNEYQYGTGNSPRGSVSDRSVHFDQQLAVPQPGDTPDEEGQQSLRRRRSISQVGGVNSVANFARSWTRAAGFHEVGPHRPSFVLAAEQDTTDETLQYGRGDPAGHANWTSLLGASLKNTSSEHAIDDESMMGENEYNPLLAGRYNLDSERGSVAGRGSIRNAFDFAPHLAAGSYGTSYGTIHSVRNEPSMIHAANIWNEEHGGKRIPEGEHMPLVVKEIEQDGRKILVVEGQSTLPQTVFNSTNVLIGVGLLSLPMGLKYSGWLCGMLFLLLSAWTTSYTAKILAKCMDVDPSLITFADLAFISYGQKARIATSVLFTMELLAACVALTVLFADTLDILIPGYGVIPWKIFCGILLIPLNFAPLRLLSFSSVVGIFSCFCIVLIVFIDGFSKPHTPGSLIEPAQTYLFPNNWLTLPLSFGLLMSPWGGHGVFPNIYRDMRHPHKFQRAVKITFSFTYLLDAATAVAGLMMFGDGVKDAITANILETTSYPRILTILMTFFIAIIPLTKVPLNARPIVSTLELFTGLDAHSLSDPALSSTQLYTYSIAKIFIRIAVVIVFVFISIIFPAFDSIMAFMGSTLCFTICVILPLLFYLKIFGKEISLRERVLDWVLIGVCSVMALVGTVWAFLPKSWIGAA